MALPPFIMHAGDAHSKWLNECAAAAKAGLTETPPAEEAVEEEVEASAEEPKKTEVKPSKKAAPKRKKKASAKKSSKG